MIILNINQLTLRPTYNQMTMEAIYRKCFKILAFKYFK